MLMKTILFGIIISLLISVSVHSQGFWEWGDPFPLTDSTSDNCNPFLLPAHFNSSAVEFMFWDKATDSISTELWMNNLGDGLPPEVILSDSGVHYTHPKVMSTQYYSYPDSLFYVFYETNQNGNQDIYYIVYQSDGSFTDPEPLTTSPNNDTQLSIDRELFFDANLTELNNIAWISDGRLYASTLIDDNGQYFSDAVLIDSNICNGPSVSGNEGFGYTPKGVLYERSDTTGTHIYQSTFEGNGVWSAPEAFYDSTESKNPTRAAFYGNGCWTTYIDTSWRVIIQDWDQSYFIYDISKSTPFDPTVLGLVELVYAEFYLLWIAVTFPEDGVDEIFMKDVYGSPAFENFTNSGTMNRNPGFFNGEFYSFGCWYDYLVWESFRNGHWQIWASKTLQCAGIVNEEESEYYISIHPNPFTHETTLEFTLNNRSEVLIEVYDNRGMHISTIANKTFDQGKHQLRWDGGGVKAGVYIIKMTVGDMVYTEKVVKSR